MNLSNDEDMSENNQQQLERDDKWSNPGFGEPGGINHVSR
jgi:hypothetical protein